MIKRNLTFSKPAYLRVSKNQLLVEYPEKRNTKVPKSQLLKLEEPQIPYAQIPIEDIALIVLEHPQITLSMQLISKLMENNATVVHCDSRHLPSGITLPTYGHSEQSERYRQQIEVGAVLKKNLWRQTVQAKILNQAGHLHERAVPTENMKHWSDAVQSGDKMNHEARAATYYWQNLFGIAGFTRERAGMPPNNLLNYGYAILRAIVARALVSSGLLPTLGIHHQNKYNPFCLADDIMEPYRPYVDVIVAHIVDNGDEYEELTRENKQLLMSIATMDVFLDEKKSPLMVAVSRTTNSLYECYAGLRRKILYPIWQ